MLVLLVVVVLERWRLLFGIVRFKVKGTAEVLYGNWALGLEVVLVLVLECLYLFLDLLFHWEIVIPPKTKPPFSELRKNHQYLAGTEILKHRNLTLPLFFSLCGFISVQSQTSIENSFLNRLFIQSASAYLGAPFKKNTAMSPFGI